MLSFTHRFLLLILDSSFCHKLSLLCYSSQPFKMHLWFMKMGVLSFSSSLLVLGISRYCPPCSLSKGKKNSAFWGISRALHGEDSSPTAVCSCLARFARTPIPSSVSTSADQWIPQQRQEQNKTREVTHTGAQRDKGRERGSQRNDTTTSSA